MILLDTDHVTVLWHEEDPRCAALEARLGATGSQRFSTTVITVEEQMRGWLAEIGRRRDARAQVAVYERLAKLIRFFGQWEVVPFDARAADEFERLRKQRIRIGTPDLKIASIALTPDTLLLSANLRDSQRVPRLRVENWLER
jgi:tRNA(fMet)-specific endonuclease VapC